MFRVMWDGKGEEAEVVNLPMSSLTMFLCVWNQVAKPKSENLGKIHISKPRSETKDMEVQRWIQ